MNLCNSLEDFITALNKKDFKTVKKRKIEYYNVACCFDIETSSFYQDDEKKPENKRGLMYIWVFGIEDLLITGRTWLEFIDLCQALEEHLSLFQERHLIIYVHNLGFDFQFFRSHFEFEKVFSLTEREPIKAVTKSGLEFRCSYKLSGYSLAKVGEHLTRHTVKKMVGDLDYSKVRTPLTPLTDEEYNYLLHDALVVIAYIQEEIEDHKGKITNIPLTKTGKVSEYCRKSCLYSKSSHKQKDNKYLRYRSLMKKLNINSVLEYKQLKQTFTGGFTHGNHNYINQLCYNVSSFDFTSSYPSVMVAEQYPMSKGELIQLRNKEEFEKNINLYCCMFRATFYNIRASFDYDHYISVSKCIEKENVLYDNGRLVNADKITIMLTEQDYFIIKQCYKWDAMTIKNFRRYKRGYLPRDFVLSVLNLYEKKNVLKGDENSIIEYQNSKEQLNSCYGMTVTDICRDEITYSIIGEWGHETPDYEEMIKKYNNDPRRFLFYAWGIYVTAYARRNLWNAILYLKDDYRYSDTDSVKFVNLDRHKAFFDNYNKIQERKLKRVLEWQKIPFEMANPKTNTGENKLLGAWDFEHTYTRFKYLGAKRYMYEFENGEIQMTVSGINKRECIPYLKQKYKTNDAIFNAFKDGLYIPHGFTGKQTHTYIDHETTGIVCDYLGRPYEYEEKTSIHLENSDYELSLSKDFIKYLLGITEQMI